MRQWRLQQGRSAVGCLFSLALTVVFIYIAYQVIPVYYHASEFQTAVEQEVGRAAAKYVGDDILRKNIMNLAAVHQIPLLDDDLQVVRASSQLAVDVKYSVKVTFPMYSHVFSFQFRARSIVGAL